MSESVHPDPATDLEQIPRTVETLRRELREPAPPARSLAPRAARAPRRADAREPRRAARRAAPRLRQARDRGAAHRRRDRRGRGRPRAEVSSRAGRSPSAWRRRCSQRPGSARVVREPLGVVLIIAPWNYPVQLLLSPLVGALAAGNCAVLKPSELTPHTSAVLARPRAALPRSRRASRSSRAACRRRRRCSPSASTTSSTPAAARSAHVVMEAAAKHLTPVTLELGGKSPCIVDATANLEVAARRIAWGKFLNAGPDLHRARLRARATSGARRSSLAKLGAAVHEFYGDDPKQSPDYARIVNRRHFERLARLLKDGEVAFGGQIEPESRYIAPTVLRRVRARRRRDERGDLRPDPAGAAGARRRRGDRAS